MDLVDFLKRCVNGLKTDQGMIVVKENISKDEDVFDEEDSSVTRWIRKHCTPHVYE